MRFDDSLKTVLAADTSTAFGAASAWRQLVDLMGRGRIAEAPEALAELRRLRNRVPLAVRSASARALAFVHPGPGLVALFSEDDLAIAAPVLRSAQLGADAWIALLPGVAPAGRSVLRHRRDLPAEVVRALESFGRIDFVLGYNQPVEAADVEQPTPLPEPAPVAEPEAIVAPPPGPAAPVAQVDSSFVSLGSIARGLPVVAEALRQSGTPDLPESKPDAPSRFEISDLVARIEAFNRRREAEPRPAHPSQPAEDFRWESDTNGTIRWVEGIARTPVIGLSLAGIGATGDTGFDAVSAGALRRRSEFRDARLSIGGTSEAAGSWRVSGAPIFDDPTGRFTGFRGTARRPRADEMAGTGRDRSTSADSLRQLVHELRTPTNAIAGFAELIESELLGAVPPVYRDQASIIRAHAADLIAAIDDLDTAARIEGNALELRPGTVAIAGLLRRIDNDLQPLAGLRGARLDIAPVDPAIRIAADDRATDRLLGRLMAAVVSAGGQGERIGVTAAQDGDAVSIVLDRPAALSVVADDALLSIDAEDESDLTGAPLLGTGFALRLAQNLARELGGALVMEASRLTLRLPAASMAPVEQVSIS